MQLHNPVTEKSFVVAVLLQIYCIFWRRLWTRPGISRGLELTIQNEFKAAEAMAKTCQMKNFN